MTLRESAPFFPQIRHPGSMRKVAPGHPQAGRVNGHAMARQALDELK